MLCYCHNEIPAGARVIGLQVQVDWGADDEREDVSKDYVFCSFACIADWATQRSHDWDDVVVTSPEEQTEHFPVTVDAVTDTVIRGG